MESQNICRNGVCQTWRTDAHTLDHTKSERAWCGRRRSGCFGRRSRAVERLERLPSPRGPNAAALALSFFAVEKVAQGNLY